MLLIKCAPDRDGCIDLLAVMRIMNQIDQEQAWALAYQLAALMQRLWPAGNNCATIESLAQIYINREGCVHEKTLRPPPSPPPPLEPNSGRTGPGAGDRRRPIGESTPNYHSSATAASSPSPPQDHGLSSSRERRCDEGNGHSNGHGDGNGAIPTAFSKNSSASATTASEATPPPPPPTITTATKTTTTTAAKLPPTPPITPELREQLQRRRFASSEAELVSSLGIALFWALDFGIAEDEERKLGRTMEFLIMQSQKGCGGGSDGGDLSLAELEQICIKRLPVATKAAAEQHYRSICKALFADTIELSVLLEKIYTATMVMNGANMGPQDGRPTTTPSTITTSASALANNNNNNNNSDIISHRHHQLQQQQSNYHLHHHHLLQIDQVDDLVDLPLACMRALKINDWARLWMQVIRELRQRRKFIQQQQQFESEPPPSHAAAELQAV